MNYTIEKDVPIPNKPERSSYPWARMEPGDSFKVPKGISTSLQSAIASQNEHYKGEKQFVWRTEEDFLRVWRIK